MKRIIGIALAAAALAAAGCGDTADKNEYVTSVNNAQASLTWNFFDGLATPARTAEGTRTPGTLARRLQPFARSAVPYVIAVAVTRLIVRV